MKGRDYLGLGRAKVAKYAPRADVAKVLDKFHNTKIEAFEPAHMTAISLDLSEDQIRTMLDWGPEYLENMHFYSNVYAKMPKSDLFFLMQAYFKLKGGVTPTFWMYVDEICDTCARYGGSLSFEISERMAEIGQKIKSRHEKLRTQVHRVSATPIPKPSAFGSWS